MKTTGIILIALPFIAIFAYMFFDEGFAFAIQVFAKAAGVLIAFSLGVIFLLFDREDIRFILSNWKNFK